MTKMNLPACLAGYTAQNPDTPRAAAIQWFREAKYGLFLHYGLYSLLGRHEWVQFQEAIRPGDYAHLAHHFSAERFDAGEIADFAVACGMRYINITTRHHDGFCLFHSRQSSFNSVDAAPARRDLVGELVAACEKRKLGICLYYSHGRDWKHPHAPHTTGWDDTARPAYDPPELSYATGDQHQLGYYVDFMARQIEELLTQYGPVSAIWLDGIGTPLKPRDPATGQPLTNFDPRTDGDPFRCQELYDLIHSLQPHCLVAYKQGYLGTEDFFAPEHRAYNRFDQSFAEVPGEICTTMIKEPASWGHFEGEHVQRRSHEEVWEALNQAEANGCNLLLNTGPIADGSLHPHDHAVLLEVGHERSRLIQPHQAVH